jgi:hypothetical protein
VIALEKIVLPNDEWDRRFEEIPRVGRYMDTTIGRTNFIGRDGIYIREEEP